MKKILVALSVAVGLQACSSNTPSSSEVETAIKSAFADCPNLAIEHVKVINGMKIDDSTHQIRATFDLKVIPLAEKRVEEAQSLADQRKAEEQAIHQHYDELTKRSAELDAQIGAMKMQIVQDLKDSGLTDPASDAFQARYEALDEQRGVKKLAAELDEINHQQHLEADAPQPKTQLMDVVGEWGGYACLSKSGLQYGGAHSNYWEGLTKGAVNAQDATFKMVKTDNGWMEAK